MSIFTIQINVDGLTDQQVADRINFSNDVYGVRQDIINFIRGEASGNVAFTSMRVCAGATKATGTVTFSSTGPLATETVTVNGVVFTARASGATGNEWNRSNTASVNATRLAAAINASSSVGVVDTVVASASGAVVTITSVAAGQGANQITLAEAATNTAVSGATLTGGTDGTQYLF